MQISNQVMTGEHEDDLRGRSKMLGYRRSGPHSNMRAGKGFAVLAAVIALTTGALSACSSYHFTPGTPSVYQSNTPVSVPAASAPTTPRPLVGIAISGGGNRSALFASYVLELLGSLPVTVATADPEDSNQPDSFLDTIDHISSVSGGSFANAYFGMKGPGHYRVMVTDQPVPKAYADFFNDFHAQMNFNWEGALFGLDGFSFGSNAQRLAKAIDKQFLQGATFDTLDRREKSGASPYLIFNATHYDSGRRFVMTTIPSSNFCLNTEQFLRDIVYTPAADQSRMNAKHVAKVSECDRRDPLTPEGFDSFWNPAQRAVPTADMPLAQVVAISGSFPLLIGPVPFQIEGDQSLLHLIDGSVADHSGIESITQLFLRDLIRNPKQKGLIVELDAGLPFNARGTKIAEDEFPLTTFFHDPTRLSDIQEVRASMYRQDLWAITAFTAKNMKMTDNAVTRLSIESMHPDDLKIDKLQIQTSDCHQQFNDAESVNAAARDIPTVYHLDPCSAQLVRIAACWSVHQHASAIQQFFEQTADGPKVRGTATLDQRIKDMCPELVSTGALEPKPADPAPLAIRCATMQAATSAYCS